MKNILVIFKKQLKDTFTNMAVLIQFVLFPIMTIIMENAIDVKGMPDHYFTLMFSVMYIGMAPITATAAIVSEEKEADTLRVLMMAKVTPVQYLLGVGIYVFLLCMAGGTIMGVASGITGAELGVFLVIMAIGFVISTMLGAALGILANNQMAATSITVPVIMVISFLPMLGMFNETFKKIAEITYTQQIQNIMNELSFNAFDVRGIVTIVTNAVIFTLFFIIMYKKKGLE